MAALADLAPDTTPATLQRRRVRVRGAVQGVGFRPFCVRIAARAGVTGWVRNDSHGAVVEVQGTRTAVASFLDALRRDAPPLARIQSIEPMACAVLVGERGFTIAASEHDTRTTALVPPDAATCADCLRELFTPGDRRYRYPFINCTHCGPRWTVTQRLPYDRPATSMAGFALCAACAREYGDASDRRFHAQPNACAMCGPRLTWLDADGTTRDVDDVTAHAAARLRAGGVIAVKGLGGFHLVCDATRADTLARLRGSKARATKPFAVMCLNVASAARWARVDDAESALLQATARPVVLLDKLAEADARLAEVAPGCAELGILLPAAPLHWMLSHELLGRPDGHTWLDAPNDLVLVMTSANPGGEPLVVDNAEAVQRLRGLADGFVVHDRAIVARCDDSVLRTRSAVADEPPRTQLIRRARGYVPVPISLPGVPADTPAVLACGAWMKNTVCVTRGNEAFLSPHIGDLGSAASCAALDEAVVRLTQFLDVTPRRVLHDLHPDFYSTRFAQRYAAAHGIDTAEIQHHHAHIAAVCAEHGHAGAVLGIALDGVGLGTDGAAWGGELLRVQGAAMTRIGHLAPLRLPGGDTAAREPWRIAAGVLHALGRHDEIAGRFGRHAAAAMVAQMLARDLHCPPTSSAGRVFDAAAALLGIADLNRHESEAPMALEAAAASCGGIDPWFGAWRIDDHVLDVLPLLDRLACGDNRRDAAARCAGAARFHATFAAAVAEWAIHAARALDLNVIALAGGCWLNRRLRKDVVARLTAERFTVLESIAAPPNDGGIALGQAWIGLQSFFEGT